MTKNDIVQSINRLWTFDNDQQHTHTWHDKQKLIEEIDQIDEGELSDEYHSMNELYEFRKMYNAALFNQWAKSTYEINPNIPATYDVHKSLKHHDGEDCFGGGWFIVVAMLTTGQISNHYKLKDWNLFKIPVTYKAKYQFDNHTPQDVLDRLKQIL